MAQHGAAAGPHAQRPSGRSLVATTVKNPSNAALITQTAAFLGALTVSLTRPNSGALHCPPGCS